MFLDFNGKIVTGCGRHSDLGIPGKNMLPETPDDWPEKLYPGSLNIEIFLEEVPEKINNLGPGRYIQKLDNSLFRPAIIIPQNLIINNSIGPKGPVWGRGDAQVWRTKVTVMNSGKVYDCWTLRRLDSAMWKHIELISDKYLRTVMRVADEDRVMVSIQGEMQVNHRERV